MTVLRSSITPIVRSTFNAIPTKRLAFTTAAFAFTQRRSISAFGYTQAGALIYHSYGPPTEKLSLHHYSIPPAYGNEITVKFLASPINPADINQIEGVYPSKPELTKVLGTAEPAAVGGNEGVVEVVAVGGKVQGWKKGDWAIMRSTKFGTWRTHASATAEQLLKVPSDGSVTPIQAATISVNPCTAYRMLKDFVPLKEGDWFIQNGANSGVGRAAIQLGRIWGLKSINVVRDRPDIDELREELEGLGADLVITDKELADKSIKSRIERITGGKGVGLALNCVGGDSATNLMRNLKNGGKIVTYGAMAKKPVTVPASLFIFKNISCHGFWVSVWSDLYPKEKEEMVTEIFELYKSGQFKDVPIEKAIWKDDSEQSELIKAIEKSQTGFGGKKQVFVFETK